MDGQTFRESVTDALRFWEPRRLIYNAVLAIVVLAHFGIHYSVAKAELSINFGLGVFLLAVLANVAYCAAYFPDILAQMSGYREMWQKYRWVLFVIGTSFAGILTHFFSYALFGGGGNG